MCRPSSFFVCVFFLSSSPHLLPFPMTDIPLYALRPLHSQETKIGVTVGALRQHSDSKVKALAKAIVKKWRAAVGPVGTKKEQESKRASSASNSALLRRLTMLERVAPFFADLPNLVSSSHP